MNKLISRFKDRKARIGVLGMGYVGLPLAMEFCRKGFRVTGFEVTRGRLDDLKKGRSYVLDVSTTELTEHRKSGLFEATGRFEDLSRQDVVIVCVQTPLRKTREPDIGNILSAVSQIAKHRKKGCLIVLESTTYPGTTDEIVLPLLEKTGRLGRDFFLAFSPERVDPGNKRYTIANTPKVVGGADSLSGRLAVELYSQVLESVVPVSSPRAAEVVKLLENSFRAVNIALVNEMAQICDKLKLNVWEVIEAASTKPFGFMTFYPGPGIGGHCIPKDPQLLAWKMKAINFEARFIQLATVINGQMPEYTVRRIADGLNKVKKSLNGSRILVIGVAYKPGSTDFRESPSLDVMHLLVKAGATVSYHDPYVPGLTVAGKKLKSSALTTAALKSNDCAVILTAHAEVDHARVARLSRRVFDARNALKGLRNSRKVDRL